MKKIVILLLVLAPILSLSQTSSEKSQIQSSTDSSIFPSLNSKWTVPEFQKALKIIISRQKNNSGNISLTREPDVFERITSYDNYWFLETEDNSLNDKASFSLNLLGLIKTILLNYYQKGEIINGKLLYEKETTAFMILACKIIAGQADLVDQLMKANPNLTKTQLDGLEKFASGISIIVSGLLITIEKEYMYYSVESICKLSKSLKNFYFKTKSRIAVDLKRDFDRRLITIRKGHPIQCVRESLK